MLTSQPLAFPVKHNKPFRVNPPQERPIAQFRQENSDAVTRQAAGETQLALEFNSNSKDLIQAAHFGLELADNIFSALSLSLGAPIKPCKPVYIEEAEDTENVRIAGFFGIEARAWHEPIDDSEIALIQRAFRHWETLNSGDRFRRAVRRYRQALGREDALDAFQEAYMGLESIEKPIALELGVPVGHELVEGKCESCGVTFQRKRTVLSGIRAYMCGNPDRENPKSIATERLEDWKKLSRLRTDIVHGLEEISELQARAHDARPAVLHYLHDAACHLIHAHELESDSYSLTMNLLSSIVAMGTTTEGRPTTTLDSWNPLIEITIGGWSQYDNLLVPEVGIKANTKGASGAFFFLKKPLSDASENDLEPINFEPNEAE